MLSLEKRLAKFAHYLQQDPEILSRARNKDFSTKSDIEFLKKKYSDLIITFNEYDSFIDGCYRNSSKTSYCIIAFYNLGKTFEK